MSNSKQGASYWYSATSDNTSALSDDDALVVKIIQLITKARKYLFVNPMACQEEGRYTPATTFAILQIVSSIACTCGRILCSLLLANNPC